MLSEDIPTTNTHQVTTKIKKDISSITSTLADELPKSSYFSTLSRDNILVAIPAYNEEVAIGSVIARCKKYADNVIVVDDGSKDHTAEIARLVGAEVITHEKNGGYGSAIKTCFDVARKRDLKAMVIIDADGQHNPDDIPAMIAEMGHSRSDIVIGSRFVKGNGKKQNIPIYRKVGMRVLDTATKIGSGYNITDSQSGFRIYSDKAIRTIQLSNNGMAAGSEILLQASGEKLHISEIPIYVRYDIEKTSSENPIRHGFSVLGSIIGLVSEKRPLIFFCIPGFLLLLAGIISGLLFLNVFNAIRNLSIYFVMISALCVLIGIFSIFTGLILSSIQRKKQDK